MTDYRAVLQEKGSTNDPLAKVKSKLEEFQRGITEYETVRFGEPDPGIEFEKNSKHLKSVIDLYWNNGYDAEISNKIPIDLYKAIKKFRATLDCYFAIVDKPVFSKDELYIRCLEEGPAFTEYIKKSRSTTLRYHTAETETSIDENYVCEGYTGYDSIFHERGFIHWDDRLSVDDIKHCFIPANPVDIEEFDEIFDTYLNFTKIDESDFRSSLDFDMLGGLQPTSMYDPVTGKTRLMREFWSKDIDLDEPYMGKRSVVLTFPGSTRDALVGTPSTVARVKMLNKLARVVSEKCMHSANASGNRGSSRYLRVLKRHWYMHLDFKKYGLMFPRSLQNAAIRAICKRAGISPKNLLIDDVYVDIDGETYKTERGIALGWLDPINALCINAILHNLSVTKGMMFDWVGFNDDFELGFWEGGDMTNLLNAMRETLFIEFDHWDIGLSADKIYGSRASVFLESYVYFEKHYKLDMLKRQLACQAYATSLIQPIPWIAKLYFSQAWLAVENEYCRDRCFNTCPIEFDENEIFMPVEFGGWYNNEHPLLSDSIRQCDDKYLYLGALLGKIEVPEYSAPVKKVSKPAEIRERTNVKAFSAKSAEYYRLVVTDPGTLEEINDEAESAPQLVEYLMDAYFGRFFELRNVLISHALERRSSGRQPPPL